ncbi:MAG: hypothetical protein NTX53_01935 [candidate division WOR-3 bacterium]|nr:hypothetical protein [candidate division WOR-3 bacterium]
MKRIPRIGRCASSRVLAAVLFVVVYGQALAGYGLELVARGDTIQRVSPNGTSEFHFTLTNTGSQSDAYEFDCRVVASVPGWVVVCCVGGQCVEPGNQVYDTLPAGAADTAIKVTVYTNATEGEEVVSLRARSMGDPALAESIATHTIVGSGIDEDARLDAPEAHFRVAPTLVNRQTGASVAFATREQTFFRVTLHDAVGRLVQLVASSAVPAGRHRIRWQPERGLPDGVYVLHLSAGSESAVAKVIVE